MLKLNKPLKITLIAIITIGLMAATIAGAIWVTNTQSAKQANEKRKCDVSSYDSYKVVIANGQIKPKHTEAKLCDKLTITNRDGKARKIAFGQHNQHVSYDGVTEKQLNPGDSLTITLNKAGQYRFHDHYQDEVAGTFTVTETKK